MWGAPLAPPCFFLLIVECSGKLTLSLLKVSGHDVGFFLGVGRIIYLNEPGVCKEAEEAIALITVVNNV